MLRKSIPLCRPSRVPFTLFQFLQKRCNLAFCFVERALRPAVPRQAHCVGYSGAFSHWPVPSPPAAFSVPDSRNSWHHKNRSSPCPSSRIRSVTLSRKIPVVSYHNNGSFIGPKIFFQPSDHRFIQMVRRLIQQKYVKII